MPCFSPTGSGRRLAPPQGRERFNPDWRDLYETLNSFEGGAAPLDPALRGGDNRGSSPAESA